MRQASAHQQASLLKTPLNDKIKTHCTRALQGPYAMSAHHLHPANISRREIMRLGIGGLSALSVSDLISQRSQAAQASNKETAVILVWLPGGHSHLETYDPKPRATSDFRGPYAPIQTVVPGIEISELLYFTKQIMYKV